MRTTITEEFKERVFNESYPRILHCLSITSEEFLWNSPNKHITSIGSQVLHIIGNARQWIVSGLGGRTDSRNRPWEFQQHPEISSSALIAELAVLKQELEETLDALTEAVLHKEYAIQGFSTSGFSALVHVIEHISYHTGQISLLTKLEHNVDLGYYANLDLSMKNK